MSSRVVSDLDQCHTALRQVLESHAFARSEQARRFLRFVCEKTLLGEAADIKEYSIGVEALGRPLDYSPADDSSVRRRAYEIRRRLEEFYATEMVDAPVRIELPKGSYVPVFTEWTVQAPSVEPQAALPVAVDPPAVPAPKAVNQNHRLLVALVLGAVLGAALLTGVYAWRSSAPGRVDATVAEFWGPMLDRQSRTLICLGNALYMTVRAAPFPSDVDLPSFPAPDELYASYAQHRPMPKGAQLFMRPVDNVAPVGMISGVAVAASTLRLAGAAYEVLPERTAPLASFRGRNVILFGDALTSFAAARELGLAYYTIGYDATGTRLVIRDRRKRATDPPVFSRKPETGSGTVEAFGLITALPGEGSDAAHHRTFVISGVSNAGIHGAMEFLTSPERLEALRQRFRREGWKEIPPAWQVVVKCSTSSSLLLNYEYETHEVIDPQVASALPRE